LALFNLIIAVSVEVLGRLKKTEVSDYENILTFHRKMFPHIYNTNGKMNASLFLTPITGCTQRNGNAAFRFPHK
jgi:hypothetical protein